MASGLLSGELDAARVATLPADDWRRSAPAFQGAALERTLTLVEELRPLAERIGASLPELAVAWTLHQPGVTAAIVGSRDAAHVGTWVGASDLDLDEETLAGIGEALVRSGAGSDEPQALPAHIAALPGTEGEK